YNVLDVRLILITVHSLFFFNATSPPALYTLSLHDALPISGGAHEDGEDPEDDHGGVNPLYGLGLRSRQRPGSPARSRSAHRRGCTPRAPGRARSSRPTG